MAILLNRKYGSRLECLYYILKACYAKYGTQKTFSLNDLKFDDDDENNVQMFCQLTNDFLGMQKCCPYLVNPLDTSKCYATQSIISDSTKSKAVSDVGGSLEALGFIARYGARLYKITPNGERWANADYYSSEWEDIARGGVLSYGLVVGFCSILKDHPNEFSLSKIYLGYPQTEETVEYWENGKLYMVNISTGSEPDSVTRTKSKIIAWCVTVGLVVPVGVADSPAEKLAHLKYRDFLNQKELTCRKFRKTEICEKLFDNKIHVMNPLAYSRLHKAVKSMRENGGEVLRRATMQVNDKILNRRFVFTYVLNYYSKNGKALPFDQLIEKMKNYSDLFFTPNNDEYAIMASECQIADFTGIPFQEINGKIYPLTTINEKVLCEDAPASIVSVAKKIIVALENENK